MGLDLGGAVRTQATLGPAVEQVHEQVLGGGRYHFGPREVQRLGQDLAVHLVGVLVVVRGQPRQHLVQQHAQRPPVDRLAVTLAEEEFGREVFGGAAER